MRKVEFLLYVFLAMSVTSCARAPLRHTEILYPIEPVPFVLENVITAPDVLRSDVFHEVGPGETVWRISMMYDVDKDEVARVNKLNDPNKLEKGQKLLILNAAPLRSVVPLRPSKKWKYIIIHHSATDVGKALSFDHVHSQQRLWKGLGYHFVIDNGTSGKKDGQIEVSPRWIHEDNGAHCKADGMNYKGIGICLVGNFNEDNVMSNQMDALAYLVNELKKTYHIPNSHILGHGQVNGANTDCPGKKFPWREFRSRLNP